MPCILVAGVRRLFEVGAALAAFEVAFRILAEQPTGDGPGGTSDFASRIERLGARLAVVNPTRL